MKKSKNVPARRLAAMSAAICMTALLLSGCGGKPGFDAFGGIQTRDPAAGVQVAMASEIAVQDGSGTSYRSSATWDDANGVRHMYGAAAEISSGGAEPETTASEAWSDPDGIYLDVNGAGWLKREPGTGADRPAALDLDAAISLIGRLPKLYEDSEPETAEPDMRAGLSEAYSFDVKFSDVKKLAGGASEGLKFDGARLTCGFDGAGLKFVRAEAAGDAGLFLVDIDVLQWNAADMALEIPASVTDPRPAGDPEISIEKPATDLSGSYAMEYDIPDSFQGGELAAVAKGIEAGGARFDRIQAAGLDGFDELQYHTHGPLGAGLWQAALSVEKHPDATLAAERQAALQAFNDVWYDGRPDASGGWLCWAGEDRDGRAAMELVRADGDTLYLLQAVAAGVPDAVPADLVQGAESVLADIGQKVDISFET